MPFGSVALTGEMWWEIFKNLVGMRQGMRQLGGGFPGDFMGIARGFHIIWRDFVQNAWCFAWVSGGFR